MAQRVPCLILRRTASLGEATSDRRSEVVVAAKEVTADVALPREDGQHQVLVDVLPHAPPRFLHLSYAELRDTAILVEALVQKDLEPAHLAACSGQALDARRCVVRDVHRCA